MHRKVVPFYVAAAFACTAGLFATAQTNWIDPSPHRAKQVRVDADVDLEMLDWGGTGRTLVLLAQLGQTAHIYDNWAPRLASKYRVIGVTRRGYGASSAPAVGYSTSRLGQDLLAVLDAEKIERPVLVGNQFAGEELSWIGIEAAARVAGLVYLDAAYDRSNMADEVALQRRIPPPPPP
jgi:non-heme chloroperoxidase